MTQAVPRSASARRTTERACATYAAGSNAGAVSQETMSSGDARRHAPPTEIADAASRDAGDEHASPTFAAWDRGRPVPSMMPFSLGSLVGRSVRASTLYMDHSLDESELDCRASFKSVCRSSETLSNCAHLRRERLSRSPPPTRPSTPPFQRPASIGRPLARQIGARFACVNARPTDMWTPAHANKAARVIHLPGAIRRDARADHSRTRFRS
jgi:hypothetical protein